MPPTTDELTFEDRVKMRRMLDALDQKEAGGMKEFDLNKPPSKPYIYSEYPFLMYQDGKTRAARNREEREQMLASGWREDPTPVEEKPEVTDNRKRR